MTKTTTRDLCAVAVLLALLCMIVACGHTAGSGPRAYEQAERPADSYGAWPAEQSAHGAVDGFALNPLAGAFFNDGDEGDVRARSENIYTTDLPPAHAVDELVVIERADGERQTYDPTRIAALRAKVDGVASGQPLPLDHTDVRAKVALNVSSVTVTQTFTNPFATKIEAVYVFPLPQDAAVSDFVMVIGERRIRGVVRERDEARRIYEQARAQGHHASLLSQERPNVFTQSVANIEPDQRIDVETTYFQTLPWRDGAFEMVVPTVVGPRFNPPGSTDGVGAAAAHAQGTSGQPVEVLYRTDSDGSGPGIGIEVALDAGVPLGEVTCASHPVDVERDGERCARVRLRDGEAVPNRDFVLRFAPRDRELCGAVSVHRDPESGDGWFTLLLQPPLERVDVAPQPRELVFVVDCSGSMEGEPLSTCKRAIRRCLERLGPEDTFSIVRFSDSASALGDAPMAATPANVRRGLAYTDALSSGGGTMMERGVTAALRPRIAAGRRRIVTFMTDGFIGNENDILRAVHEHVGDARVFSFGVGSSVNRFLLERMADVGRGVAAYIDVGDSGQAQVDALFARLERPALADLQIDWGGADVRDVEPRRLPDLFVDRPLLVHGRVRGALPREVTVRGRIGRSQASVALPVGATREHPALAKLWARARIRSLSDATAWTETPAELHDEVKRLALQHGLASAATSFVAVDASGRTAGEFGVTVPVAVPVPRGTRYETTVPGGGR